MSSEHLRIPTGPSDDSQPDAQSPSTGFIGDEVDLGGAAVHRSRISDGTIILVAALVVAGFVLWGMRWLGAKSGGLQADTTVEKQIEDWLRTLTGADDPDVAAGSRIVIGADISLAGLNDDRTESQVPLDDVKKNPFVFVGVSAGPDDGATPIDAESTRQRELEKQRQALQKSVDRLKVSSIMGKPGHFVAVVGGQVVQVGDKVNGTFTVTSITSFSVSIEADGFKFKLSLGDGS